MSNINWKIKDEGDGNTTARVWVDNPEHLNVLNSKAIEKMTAVFQDIGENNDIRLVVLSGTGNKAFIGGADLKELITFDSDSSEVFITKLHKLCETIRKLPVPVIARIFGYCLGAGLEIAVSCDMRIAADNASFAMPEVKVGIPSVIEAALLPRLIGWGRTARLIYTGELINARTALGWGLVEEVTPANELDDAVKELVTAVCSAGPKVIRIQKKLLLEWEKSSLDKAIKAGIRSISDSYKSDEPRQMMQSFLNRKR